MLVRVDVVVSGGRACLDGVCDHPHHSPIKHLDQKLFISPIDIHKPVFEDKDRAGELCESDG